MRCKKNIILNLQNITSHFAGSAKIITLSLVIIMLSFANIINTSALSYQSNVGIGFTFNPTLSINISPSDLIIDNLTPGTVSDSNVINVSVATNSAYGYILTTSVGNNTTYNTTNLVHTNGSSVFSSISTNTNLTSLEDVSDNNIWGYSHKLSGNNTWSNYSGLPLYSSSLKVLLNTDSNTEPGPNSLDFKIAAKASTTQPSGVYSNIINFSAVTKPTPTTLTEAYANYYQATNKTMHNGYYVMQDMADSHICENTEVIGSELQVIDIRDDKVYWIAKLADGHCWMTQNLDLAGGTEITAELSDISEGYILPTNSGFQINNRLPVSSSNGFSADNKAFVYNSNRTECANPGCYSYYSWMAATVGSGIDTEGADAPYSICPKGWKLPSSRNSTMQDYQSSDFYKLTAAYQMNPAKLLQPNSVPNFVLSGNYYQGRFYAGDGGIFGYYWSSTSATSHNGIISASSLAINSSRLNPAYAEYRKNGYAIRCLAR